MTSGKIILLNGGIQLSPEERERQAVETLERLEITQPSGAAPFTEEDLAIYKDRLARFGDEFALYAQAAYVDYCYFFISAVTIARERAMEQLQ